MDAGRWTIAESGGVLVVRARFSVLDAVAGLRPPTQPSGLLLQAFGPDGAEDDITETPTMVQFDVVEYEFPLAELDSGRGLYTLRPIHSTEVYHYRPNELTIDLRDTWALVNDGAPSQTGFVTTLPYGADDDWLNAWALFETGNNAGMGPRKITGSTNSGGNAALAFSPGFAQAVADEDVLRIINR